MLSAIFDAPILFFFFGLMAVFVGSNLEIPQQVAKFFSLYLLMAIGFKGGVALAQSGVDATMMLAIAAGMIMSLLVPAYSYVILRRKLPAFDAAAVSATYGSVSAVTFIAATSFLTNQGHQPAGYMTVVLVLMESPAIIMAIFLARIARAKAGTSAALQPASLSAAAMPAAAPGSAAADDAKMAAMRILKEAFTDGAHLLLLGSLAIGLLSGETGAAKLNPFINAIFPGVLAFFLLDMGLLVAKRMKEARVLSPFLIGFALVMPVFNAGIAAMLSAAFALPLADAVMLAVLSASASYIVVPAVVRYAIPEANPSIYFTLSLAITFPFNITLGIPLYYAMVSWIWGNV
jgi:hypothetical protein